LRQRKPDALTMLATVQVHDTRIDVTCCTAAIAAALDLAAHPDAPDTITLTDQARLTRSGCAMRLVQGDGQAASASPDRSLVKALLQARRWWSELRHGGIDITRLAEREKVSPAYATRIVRLAFLSPQVAEAILAGRKCANVAAKTLTLEAPPAASWKEQAARPGAPLIDPLSSYDPHSGSRQYFGTTGTQSFIHVACRQVSNVGTGRVHADKSVSPIPVIPGEFTRALFGDHRHLHAGQVGVHGARGMGRRSR
jgi:hypothetical protein